MFFILPNLDCFEGGIRLLYGRICLISAHLSDMPFKSWLQVFKPLDKTPQWILLIYDEVIVKRQRLHILNNQSTYDLSKLGKAQINYYINLNTGINYIQQPQI